MTKEEMLIAQKKRALQQLQESYVPESITCREEEKSKIRKFIKEGAAHSGNTNSLYISGLPGLGKTACVLEVVREISTRRKSNLRFLQLNCLKLKTPNEFYTLLLKLMSGVERRPEAAKNELNRFFTLKEWGVRARPNHVRPGETTLLLVDEIDYLLTRDQDILYTLFNWTHEEQARLAIVCIANTLDFPEKLLDKIESRMGHQRLIFSPYSSTDLQHIIETRLKHYPVFSADAIRFVSKKIAAYSSDVRKSLHICRLALEISLGGRQKGSDVGPDLINQAFENYYSNPMVSVLQTRPLPSKVILVALVNFFRRAQCKFVSSFDLYNKYKYYSRLILSSDFRFYQFKTMLKKLARYGVVQLRLSPNLVQEVHLAVPVDSVLFALKDESKISTYIDLGNCD